MQVMGDMLERIVQASAQQSGAAPQQTSTSDRHVVGSTSSKSADEHGASPAHASNNPMTILPGKR